MRLKIRIYCPTSPLQPSKHLIYIPPSLQTIQQVQQHLKEILEIKGDLVLKSGEYVLPRKESVMVLEDGAIVDGEIRGGSGGRRGVQIGGREKLKEKGRIRNQRLIKKSESENKIESSCSSSSQQQSENSSVEIKIQKSLKKAKLQQKLNPPLSSSSSPSQSSQSPQQTPIKRQQNKKITIQLPTKSQPTLSTFLSSTKKQVNEKKFNQFIIKNQKSVLEDEEMEEDVYKGKSMEEKGRQRGDEKGERMFKLVDLSKEKQFQSKQTNNNKNNISNTVNNNSKSVPTKTGQPKRQIVKSTIVPPLPIQPSSFHTNQKQIPMKTVQRYTQLNKKGFLQVNDQIEYKITEFDEERFLPVLSDWIAGRVREVDGKGSVGLVLRDGKEVKLAQINMFGLKVKGDCIVGERKIFLEQPTILTPIPSQLTSLPTPSPNPTISTPSSIPPPSLSKSQQLIQQFNYYFSDTNYNNDNYLRMHASKNNQSCNLIINLDIPLKCFMNFNKLKPLVKNEIELERVLREANLKECSFEVHQEKKMVRKRGGQCEGEGERKKEVVN